MTRLFYASKLIGVAAFGASQLLVLDGCGVGGNAAAAALPNLDGVERLDFSGDGEIELRQGAAAMQVDNDGVKPIEITREGNALRIHVGHHFTGTPKFVITLPKLDTINVAGAAKVSGADLHLGELKIDSKGATKFTLTNLTATSLAVDSSGASTFSFSGVAPQQTVSVSGASNYDAFALRSQNVSVDASGASHVKVHADTKLKLDGSGAGDLEYGGKPALEQETSGMFRVKHRDA